VGADLDRRCGGGAGLAPVSWTNPAIAPKGPYEPAAELSEGRAGENECQQSFLAGGPRVDGIGHRTHRTDRPDGAWDPPMCPMSPMPRGVNRGACPDRLGTPVSFFGTQDQSFGTLEQGGGSRSTYLHIETYTVPRDGLCNCSLFRLFCVKMGIDDGDE
jgi:hypothetical protein